MDGERAQLLAACPEPAEVEARRVSVETVPRQQSQRCRRPSVLAILGATSASLSLSWALAPASVFRVLASTTASFGARASGLRGLWQKAPQKRKGSFLVIGDWGWDDQVHGNDILSTKCQKLIGDAMLDKSRELGDVKFIVNVGDSFYPRGVFGKDDPQWEEKWRKIYDPELRSVPWYSVYGNHDYLQDPCACSNGPEGCAQVNKDINNLDYFYMPDVNWFIEHPELDLEVVGMDLNEYEFGWNRQAPPEIQCPLDCAYTKCQTTCEWNMKYRARDAFNLFHNRSAKSAAKNMVVFSHYPTDYFWNHSHFLDGLSDRSRHHIAYFSGHRHSTDDTSTISTAPNTNWVVGGGGGWNCDSTKQGFVVGEIGADGELSTYSVIVDPATCCDKPLPPGPPGPPGWNPKCQLRPDVELI